MGIVRRQGLQNIFILYSGFALGYVNKVLLFSSVLSENQYGLIELLLGFAVILSEICRLGFTWIYFRFLPYFKDNQARIKPFNGLFIIYAVAGTFLALLILLIFKGPIQSSYAENSLLFSENYLYLFPITIFLALSEGLGDVLRAHLKTVLPSFIREVLLRGWQTLLILLFFYKVIDFPAFLFWFMMGYAFQFAGMLSYLVFLGRFPVQFKISFLKSRIFRYILRFGFFSLFNTISYRIINRLDIVMIGLMLGLEETAVYGLAYYVGLLVIMPGRSVGLVALPIINQNIKTKNYGNISDIYKKSSMSNIILGGILFLGVWINAPSLFELLPKEYAGGLWVIFWIGIANLLDLITSLNGVILISSKYYRFDIYINVLLIALIISTNLIFIPLLGVTGAALASAICMFIANALRFYIIKLKFNLSPFSPKTPLAILILVITLGINYLIPRMGGPIVDIVLRSAIIGTFYFGIVLATKVFPDLNKLAVTILKKAKMMR